ncbi:MAG: hypothetical protein JW917_00330 [Ignavibacteria bacterium]|nr:hypothetical protein [Ignavibacteria bacterium]
MEDKNKIFDRCPHCNYPLTSWQQILLNIDRALVCKNCWYRISIDDDKNDIKKEKEKNN